MYCGSVLDGEQTYRPDSVLNILIAFKQEQTLFRKAVYTMQDSVMNILISFKHARTNSVQKSGVYVLNILIAYKQELTLFRKASYSSEFIKSKRMTRFRSEYFHSFQY